MSILFEAGPMLDAKKTGVGYYVDHMMHALSGYKDSEMRLTGYYFDFLGHNHVREPQGMSFKKIRVMPGKILSLSRRLGFQPFLELFVRQQADVVMFTNYVSLPHIKKSKVVVIIYDLGFLDEPGFVQERNLKYLNRFCPPSIRKADAIITISEFTKERIKYYFPEIKSDIIVTPIPPVQERIVKKPLSRRLKQLGVAPEKYILYVGTIEPRKNLQNLLSAYAQLDESLREEYALVIAGGKGWKDDAILADLHASQSKGLRVIQTGYFTDDEKSSLYGNATCFVLPSHYEGFGMPVLEAMAHKVPVAVSDIPVLRETAGDAALYFDKDSVPELADTLQALLESRSLRDKLIQKSTIHLRNFSWDKNATAAHAVLQRLVNKL